MKTGARSTRAKLRLLLSGLGTVLAVAAALPALAGYACPGGPLDGMSSTFKWISDAVSFTPTAPATGPAFLQSMTPAQHFSRQLANGDYLCGTAQMMMCIYYYDGIPQCTQYAQGRSAAYASQDGCYGGAAPDSNFAIHLDSVMFQNGKVVDHIGGGEYGIAVGSTGFNYPGNPGDLWLMQTNAVFTGPAGPVDISDLAGQYNTTPYPACQGIIGWC